MRKLIVVLMLIIFSWPVCGHADEVSDIEERLERVLQRIEALEAQIREHEAKAQTRGHVISTLDEKKSPWDTIKQPFEWLTLGVDVVGYYQGGEEGSVSGENFDHAYGAGFAADLEMTIEPFKTGEFYLRFHAGDASGADRRRERAGASFADLNTINDDNPDDGFVDLIEATFTYKFFNQHVWMTVGKTEPAVFIDINAFANDEITQFVGKPFVNDPVFDSEDEYAPLLALAMSPDLESVVLTLLYQSSSWPLLETDRQKSKYDHPFNDPFLAAQFAYSNQICGLEGNYRLYGWTQTYEHPRLGGHGEQEGWGVGLSLDQMVHEKVGVFARLGYHNDEVYEVPLFWSVGVALKGIIPSREQDHLGLGFAGLVANDALPHADTEYHVEAYYRLSINNYVAISPDVQFIVRPLGDRDNDDIVAAMLRAELVF